MDADSGNGRGDPAQRAVNGEFGISKAPLWQRSGAFLWSHVGPQPQRSLAATFADAGAAKKAHSRDG
jgi:hypothetical protein